MSTWTKRIAIAVLIAIPTLGFAVTKYRAAHKGCSASSSCCHHAKH